MALSKSTRIIILLVIDTTFFLLELITGYAVHSLALISDSFHMLNDCMALCVGLWAVKIANRKTSQDQLKKYTYGWQRAETLGALVNGVFLVALCVTIFLEAIQRFVEPQVVSQPVLILVVGCLGLASNLVGLVLFHDHSHGHGGGSHGHIHDHGHDDARHVEEGTASPHLEGGCGEAHAERSPHTTASEAIPVAGSDNLGHRGSKPRHSMQSQSSRSRYRAYSVIDEIHVNPSDFRRSIIVAGNLDQSRSPDSLTDDEDAILDESEVTNGDRRQTDSKGLLANSSNNYGTIKKRRSIDHKSHKHAQPKPSTKGGGHSHADLNMRGIFLHVMGDALGNIGVIATALVIWLTDVPWRFYFDPAISLMITCIILTSAIPLCKAASRILLQAVPAGINVDDIRADIEELPGVLSCHHLHVWQLSDTKLVASLHVQLSFDFNCDGSSRYMQLAQAIRTCLHEYSIHSSTIQPEFCLDPAHDHAGGSGSPTEQSGDGNLDSRVASKAGSMREPDPCLLDCGEECGNNQACCAPAQDVERT